MKWFKHNATASYADDLLLIREELGFAGLGAYWQIMEMLSLHNGRNSLRQILMLKCKGFPEWKIRRVIELADALSVDQQGFVQLAKAEQGLSKELYSAVAQLDLAEQNSSMRARKEENREEIELEKEETEAEEEKSAADAASLNDEAQTAVSSQLDRVRGWLLDEHNRVWREPMMMRSGYSALLNRYWPQAVEYFISHLLAQDKLGDMADGHDTRQYFSNFSKLSVASGRALMEHLSALGQQTVITAAQTSGPPLPKGAPPRPSPTAVWNYATDSWTELRN